MPQFLCPTVIGRRAELEELIDRLDSPRGSTVVVMGDAGIGKTRLIRELSRVAHARGLLALSGRAVAGRQGTPYRPLAEALVTACRRSGPPLSAELVPYRPALGRLIPEWHRSELAPSVESTVVLGEAVLRMLHVLGRGLGVLLAIEDVHWADPETLEVLEYLADHAGEERIVCVMTARSDPGPGLDMVRALVGRRSGTLLELAALSKAEVAEMVRECLGSRILPDGLEELLARAEGVPFLVEELLAAAVEGGALARAGDGWALRPGAVAVVPRTLTDTVAQRLAGLGVADRHVVGAAALLGRRIDSGLLAGVVGCAPADVLEALERTAALQLVIRDAGGYHFRHALTQDAVLALLVPETRADLAHRARAVIEAAHPALPGQWGQLAVELCLAAGDVNDAAGLLLVAGRRAIDGGALTTASHVLDRARDLVQDDPALALAVDELRTEAAARAGDVHAAFTLGRALVDGVDDPSRRAEIHLLLAEAATAATHWAAAQEQLAMARPLACGEGMIARIDAMTAHVLMGDSRLAEAEAHADRARGAAERTVLPDVACSALEVLGRVARTRDLADAESFFTRQLAIATAHKLTLWTVRATHELGTLDLMRSNQADRVRRARKLAIEAGALSTVATLDLQLAASSWLALDAPGCLDAARRSQHAAHRRDLGLVLAEALLMEAGAHAIAGHRVEMERAICDAIAVGRPEPELQAAACSRRAMWALLREDRERAVALYDKAVSIDRSAPAAYRRTYWYSWALLRTVQDVDGDRVRDEVRRVTPTGDPLAQAYLEYGDAVAAGRRGRKADAEALFDAARSRMQSPGLVAQRHLAERHVAECALADGWGRPTVWLQDSSTFFRQAGQVSVERACRALLRRAGAALPRRVHGHRDVPPALAALGITDREADVLGLIGEGLTSRQIGQRLFISPRTVDKHVERLIAKTGTTCRADLREFNT